MAKLLQKGIPDAPVVDDDGELVGIFSEVDRIKLVVQTFMPTQVEWFFPDINMFSLSQQFLGHRRRRYPVLDNGRLVGQISKRDVLREALDLFEAWLSAICPSTRPMPSRPRDCSRACRE